ncbi:MAG: hypothetical protein ACHQT8_07510 [Chlamydiales bacterium]
MSIVFLFGPSCAGKSTLGKALQESLGSQWHYIDRDDLVEQGVCPEKQANDELEARICGLSRKIIIDAQIPWRKKREEERYFLILPPLAILLERDALRTQELERNRQVALVAREYVKETHEVLSKIDKEGFDECFDSSRVALADEVRSIQKHISLPEQFSIPVIKCLLAASVIFGVLCALKRLRKL